ncbi:caspase family protein [Vibrio cortegadensis]|uniref:caspase family protein n=1 Tax=Vibrio cortegadensis TaxID=1328770 RepID=UPI0021C2B841|nr:caspase family protein [Vibrio cortegadensis]MDN3699653.1 caspase family protein [Vibrio cortegadensis]
MNLGIVLAVSDYGSKDNDLPGCAADAVAVTSILKQDSKYADVLELSTNTTSANVKAQLIEFINKHKGKEAIDEVVFYYSGHGDFTGNEFYFLLSDFDTNRRKQTSLENEELDNLLKALNAKVTVKIVDACHSGKAYIKDSDSFDKYLNESKGKFEKCYFMFSSQLEQYSYQDEALSFFTKSIIEAVKNHTADTIRYKDIIDQVSDSFASDAEQTPFFVVQADFTEHFCTITKTLREKLSALIVSGEQEESKQQFSSLIDVIKLDAERYCDEQEAYNLFNSFIASLESKNFSGDSEELYEYSIQTSDEVADNSASIGNWLVNTDNSYFARPVYSRVERTKRVPKKSLFATASLFTDESDDNHYKTVNYSDLEVSGYRITVDQPVKLIELKAEPKYPNINAGVAFIVPLLSKTDLRVFFSYAAYDESGWNKRTLKQKLKWSTKFVALKSLTSAELSEQLVSDFSEFLLEPLNKTFDIKKEEEGTEK